jgi:peptide deformylase
MSILKVALMGHPVLRTKAQPVPPGEIQSARIQRLIDDMVATMDEYSGIGLAAPQVHEGVRIFVAGIRVGDEPVPPEEPGEPPPLVVIINPEVTAVGRAVVEGWEGCLSIPDIRGRVPRAESVRVKALDRTGTRMEFTARGLPARVIQHETDHLDGILFFDRMKSFQTLTFMEEYRRYWARDDED